MPAVDSDECGLASVYVIRAIRAESGPQHICIFVEFHLAQRATRTMRLGTDIHSMQRVQGGLNSFSCN